MTVAKQVQGQWSETHEKENLVILQGVLHIEVVSMKMIDGCTGNPEVTSVETADSFLKGWSRYKNRICCPLQASEKSLLQQAKYVIFQ